MGSTVSLRNRVAHAGQYTAIRPQYVIRYFKENFCFEEKNVARRRAIGANTRISRLIQKNQSLVVYQNRGTEIPIPFLVSDFNN